MANKKVYRFLIRIMVAFMVAANLNLVSSSPAATSAEPNAKAATAASQEPYTLHGMVTDLQGHPVQAGIHAEAGGKTVIDLATNADGSYSVSVSSREAAWVMANPYGFETQITTPDGYQVSRYFSITHNILPASDDVELNFTLPPAAALRPVAYTPTGSLMNFDDLDKIIISPEYPGYSEVWGVFPESEMSLGVPAEASIGVESWAVPLDGERSHYQLSVSVPPNEPVFLMLLWEVPGVGTIPLRADNLGQGYNLAEGEARQINLVCDFAETEYRRAQELKTRLEGEGHSFSAQVLNVLTQANAALATARAEGDEKQKALDSYTVLRLAIQAKEKLTVAAAESDLPLRRNSFTVTVQDENGSPIPGASVAYRQEKLDFVLTPSLSGNFEPYPYSGLRSALEVGFQSVYLPYRWKNLEPQDGVFDFSNIDHVIDQYQGMGFDAVVALAWMGENVPDWAAHLDFATLKQKLSEFMRVAVANLAGRTKYVYAAAEINLHTLTGSRYISVAYPNNYQDKVQPDELVGLIGAAFQGARAAHTDVQLGYYGVTDYGADINPLPWGRNMPGYALLKQVLAAGIHPDFIGVEFYPGTGTVPQDLSSVADTLRAYHDLSGVPVMVAETFGYSARTDDYGMTGPVPRVYWHEGFTHAAQTEWDTSFYKIALSLPYMIGLQMFMSGGPDYYPLPNGDPPADCTGIYDCAAYGTDIINHDGVPKPVFYALRDLFASVKANGSAPTDAQGHVSFAGLGGMYAIEVTTPDGLKQTFEREINAGSPTITITVVSRQGWLDLQQHLAKATTEVNWSSQLGRTLDYADLRSKLSQARAALTGGNYLEARSLADQILEATAIAIDGDPSDWQGIPPILTNPPGDVQVNVPGVDLTGLRAIMDEVYLYILLEVNDPPIVMQPEALEGWMRFPTFGVDLYPLSGEKYAFVVNILYRGQIDLFGPGDPSFKGTYYSVATKDAVEIRLPRSLLGNSSQMQASALVSVLENGAPKIVKTFDRSAPVLHPQVSTYLPIVKR
jgi:protocatechuate 3,4-dioxygenase beta subunit